VPSRKHPIPSRAIAKGAVSRYGGFKLDARWACGIVKTVKRKRPLPDATATSDAIVPEVILERARRTI
jgi:hypothetical protein